MEIKNKTDQLAAIQRYISNTNMKGENRNYGMSTSEIIALADEVIASYNICDIICLAFKYGRAKGYRQAIKAIQQKQIT